jgi:hypothetical protein
MYVENFLDFDSDPVWFSLGNPTPKSGTVETPGEEVSNDAPEATPDASKAEVPSIVAESSRDKPIPVGSTGESDVFQITVLETIPNATDIVLEENQFNDPPEAGYQFFIARVSVTSIGDEAADPSFELNFQSVGESAVGYSTFDPGCGVYPEDQYSAGELFPGGTVEFNVCWMVESSDEASLVMYVEPLLSFDEDPVWFALE